MQVTFDRAYVASLAACQDDTTDDLVAALPAAGRNTSHSRRPESRDDDYPILFSMQTTDTEDMEIGMGDRDGSTVALYSRDSRADGGDGAQTATSTNHGVVGASSRASTIHAVAPSIIQREIKQVSSCNLSQVMGHGAAVGSSSSNNMALDGFVDGDFRSGKLLDLSIPHKCHCIAFHGSLLAVGLLEGHGLALYDTTNGFSLLYTIERNDSVSAIQFQGEASREHCLLAVGGLDGVVSLYRLNTNLVELQGVRLIHEFCVHWQVSTMALKAWDEASTVLTVGDKDGNVTFCQVNKNGSGSAVATGIEERLDSGILGMDMRENLFAVCTKSGLVRVYELVIDRKGMLVLDKVVWTTQRNGPVRSIAFSNNGKRVVFGGYDKILVVVDTQLWTVTHEVQMEGTINTISFDPLDRYLSVGSRDRSIVLYDTSTLMQIKTVHTPGWVTSVSWGSVDGNENVVAIRSDPRLVSVFDLTPTHNTSVSLSSSRDPSNNSVSWSLDGRYLARIDGTQIVLSDTRNAFMDKARINVGSLLKCVVFGHTNSTRKRLAAVAVDGNLYILEVLPRSTGVELKTMHKTFIEKDLYVVAWSSDGTFLALGGKGKALHFISTSPFRRMRKPLQLDGRVWDIKFISGSAEYLNDEHRSSLSMTVATGDYMANVYDIATFQPTLQIARTRAVHCIAYHPTMPRIALGDGANMVSVVDLLRAETAHEFGVGGRVNAIEFSPCGGFLAVGSDDCRFSVHETEKYRPVQEIRSSGFALSSTFSSTGRYLALGSANNDYTVLRLGSFLSTDMVPLAEPTDLEELPDWALHEAIYRSGNGPSMIQRYMQDGSQGSFHSASLVLKNRPDAMLAFDRSNGENCFDTALKLRRPILLKLALTTFVDGSLEKENVGGLSMLTTAIPMQASGALLEMMRHQPPHFGIEVMNSMRYFKVPFTSSFQPSRRGPKERGSDKFTDPWTRRSVEEKKSEQAIDQLRTPAVLPLPGLGTKEFLSALLDMPPSVFDNESMRVVLWILWRDHVRIYFVLDMFLYAIYYGMWILFVDRTASTTSGDSNLSGGEDLALTITLTALSLVFSTKEVIQSRIGRNRSNFLSLWNATNYIRLSLVLAYLFTTASRGGPGTGLVPLAVVSTLFLTMKFLSYLRGFRGTGWLISVLKQNFLDLRGFGVVLLSILFGFAICFRLVLGDMQGACVLAGDGKGGFTEDCATDPFESISRSFLSTFELAVVGAYDPGIFEESQYSLLSALLFLAAVICILVVLLNAIIAVLSDSYARVQADATANRRRGRAELIVEYLSILPRWKRKSIEKSTYYFHALLVLDEDGRLLVDEDSWEGELNALRRDIKKEQYSATEMYRQEMAKLRAEINNDMVIFRREVVSIMDGLSGDIQEIKRSKSGVAFSGEHTRRTAKAVKSIGR